MSENLKLFDNGSTSHEGAYKHQFHSIEIISDYIIRVAAYIFVCKLPVYIKGYATLSWQPPLCGFVVLHIWAKNYNFLRLVPKFPTKIAEILGPSRHGLLAARKWPLGGYSRVLERHEEELPG